jgi:tRNA(Arg) A34 adenosine deaminase TadA
MSDHQKFIRRAIEVAKKGVDLNLGGPFGAVVVKGGQIIAEAHNEVSSSCDPTAHAEVVAIRKACKALNSYQLDGCIIYASCEPCPMCLGAIYWARPLKLYYASSKSDASKINFDDGFIYDEINKVPSQRKIPFIQMEELGAAELFRHWQNKADRQDY